MGQEKDLARLPETSSIAGKAPSLRSAVEPFIVMEVMRAAIDREAAGERVIHMEVGQPGAPAPRPVLDAARAALDHGRLAYTEALGLRSLRARIARYYADIHGLDVPMDRIAVTTGSSAGFNLAFLAAFDHGDRIALAAPGYPAYRNLLHALGLEVVDIPVDASSRYVLTPAMLEAAHRETPLAGVLVASPANPSGTVMQPAALGALIEAAHDLGIRFISDEIYHGLVYEGVAETALRFSPRRDRRQFLLQVLLHDRLADRLDGAAGDPRPAGRADRPEPLHLAAGDLADRGHRRLRGDAGARGDQGELCREPPHPPRPAAVNRLRRVPQRRRRVLRLCLGPPLLERLRSISPAACSPRPASPRRPGPDFDRVRGHQWMRFSFAGTTPDMAEAMDRHRGVAEDNRWRPCRLIRPGGDAWPGASARQRRSR